MTLEQRSILWGAPGRLAAGLVLADCAGWIPLVAELQDAEATFAGRGPSCCATCFLFAAASRAQERDEARELGLGIACLALAGMARRRGRPS